MTGENIKTEGNGNVVSGSSWDHLKGRLQEFQNRKEHTTLIFFIISRLIFLVPYSRHTDNCGVSYFDIILMICEWLTEFREEFIYKILNIKTEETPCSL